MALIVVQHGQLIAKNKIKTRKWQSNQWLRNFICTSRQLWTTGLRELMEAERAIDHGGKWQDAAAAGVTSCGSDVPLDCLFALTLTTAVHYGYFHSSDYIVVSNEITASVSLWNIYFNFIQSQWNSINMFYVCLPVCKNDRGYFFYLQVSSLRIINERFYRPLIMCSYFHKFQFYLEQSYFLMFHYCAKTGVLEN